ncbi:MAG: site-specific DNA-methyltransferase, partial [Bacteroidales bacterium]
MNNIKLKQIIIDVLKSDDRLWNEDKTELNQTLLLDLVENIDEKLIELLLQEKELRDKFFVKIKDVYVFKTNDFRFFIEENKVDNSYTQYKNRIGLTDGKRFLKDTNDVVLNWPYKDCVLEGGQSTEEGSDTYFEYSEKTKQYETKQGKRKEIFFNQVLAADEIDRLFDPKALVNWKRYPKDGEQKVKEIKRDEDGTIKENLIIKGNNLLALHSLKK